MSFHHEALLYAGEAEFVAAAVAFVREGVAAGEPALVIVAEPRLGLLRAALGADATGVQFADMARVGANPARIIPAWRDFVAGGDGRRLRGIGEPIWAGRGAAELVECQRHESLINVAFAGAPGMRLLCPYDTEALAPEVVQEAMRSHPFVRQGDAPRASDAYRGVAGCGAPFDAALPEPPGPTAVLAFARRSLAGIRRAVARHAAEAGLDGPRAADMVAAVNEVATNSVRHGGGRGSLRVWLEADALVCEIRDAGALTEPLAGRVRPAPGPAAPRGLWLANQLCDLVQLRAMAPGTVVRLHMRRG
ncbi:MAG TPA: sensor histidine kinase [Candidatus Dormibacteraeota bacterium]|nr:sensor histidine kinase [Candidatus Dormibacteraeota bacterium]